MGLWGMPPLDAVTVLLEDAALEVLVVGGVLRYISDDDPGLTGDSALLRMCSGPGCGGYSLGTGLATRVCQDHLDTVVPGLLPSAGDDIRPGMQEDAERDSRRLRLDAREAEIAEAERELAGDRRVLAILRGDAA